MREQASEEEAVSTNHIVSSQRLMFTCWNRAISRKHISHEKEKKTTTDKVMIKSAGKDVV